MRSRLASALLFTACASGASKHGPSAATPGLRLNAIESYYDIAGSTAEELRAAMLAHGPTVGELPVYAVNEWEVRWRLRPVSERGECRIESAEVELTSKTRMPRWRPPSRADQNLEADWMAFLAAVKAHENGHQELGVRAAREVLKILRAVRYQREYSCDLLVADADRAAQRTLDRFYQENRDYDESTQYGQTQGVRWPPRNLP